MHSLERDRRPISLEARATLRAVERWLEPERGLRELCARADALAGEASSESGGPSPALELRVARDLASEALVDAALRGDPQALERLIELWRRDVLRWCRLLCRPGVYPEDAAADVGEVVLTDLRRISDPRRFRAWLWSVTWRTVRGHHRRAFLRRWIPGLMPERPDPRGDVGQGYERQERAERVRAVLSSLSAEHQELLWLCYAEGLTRAELADHLQMPAGTLNRKLSRARAAFELAATTAGLAPESAGGER